jgi:hypothetical protein
VKVFAVWEPVLPTDIGPPSTENLARLSDPRVEQFWDEGLLLSEVLLELVRAHPEWLKPEEKVALASQKVVWDLVAVYPPGARWEKEPPLPDYYGGPIVYYTDGLKARLAAPRGGGK